MTGKKFQRRIEQFTCEHCGAEVTGDGYTDHCPGCLWSKHVDINPGDRASACLGAMEPIAIEGAGPVYAILYKCKKCAYEHRVKTHKHDRADAVVGIAVARARRAAVLG